MRFNWIDDLPWMYILAGVCQIITFLLGVGLDRAKTFSGRFTFVIITVLVIGTQIILQKHDQDKKDIAAENEKFRSDSIATARYDTLKAQGDRQLQYVRDSIKLVKTYILQQSELAFDICGRESNPLRIRQTGDTSWFVEVDYCSGPTEVVDIDLKVMVLFKTERGYVWVMEPTEAFNKNMRLPADKRYTGGIIFHYGSKPADDNMYFFFFGTFYNKNHKRKGYVNVFVSVNKQTNEYLPMRVTLISELRRNLAARFPEIRKFFKENHITP